jgi:hypothetical protein
VILSGEIDNPWSLFCVDIGLSNLQLTGITFDNVILKHFRVFIFKLKSDSSAHNAHTVDRID